MKTSRLVIGGSLIAIAVAALWFCPLPQAFLEIPVRPSQKILDRNGVVLYEIRGIGTMDFTPLSQIPSTIRQALLTAEDRTFYSHGGIDLRSIARAAWQDLTAGRIVSGGSTITQQYIRSLLPRRKRGIVTKLGEMMLAVKAEQQLSKDRILESYLNGAYFGHQSYGVAGAARTYFGKTLSELSLAESAFLVGLLQSPSNYDPFQNPSAGIERRNRILGQMKDSGAISADQLLTSSHEPLSLSPDRVDITAPHFVFWLLQEHASQLADTGDIRTTLDVNLQRDAEEIVRTRLSELRDKNVTSASVVVLDAHTGDVLAMVGSADYFDNRNDGSVNVAVSPRQPGSAIKPFTYALALQSGATPATTVADVETQFSTKDGTPYVPRNYDFEEHGLVRYREALANSYNIAAVKVLASVGVDRLLTFLREVGLSTLTDTPDHYGLALTLGDAEVRLLDLTRAYGIFARAGRTLNVRALSTDPQQPGVQLLDSDIAWLIANILEDNSARLPEFGGDSPLAFDRPVAAKTGTTRNSRDNWTVGFTPDRIVGVWVGNADNSPMRGTSGVTGAGPIFHDVMTAATRELPPRDFDQPAGIVEREICATSGLLATPLCPQHLREFFVSGTEPTTPDTFYVSQRIDTRNGLLASDSCPSDVVRTENVVRLPSEVQPWARAHGWNVAPENASPLCDSAAPVAETSLSINSPHEGDAFQMDPIVPDAHERLTFTATASPGTEHVNWLVNGAQQCVSDAPEFRCDWPLHPGATTITAKAGKTERSVHIVVNGSRSP